jgi:hypothetical protein
MDSKPVVVVIIRLLCVYLIAEGLTNIGPLVINPEFWKESETFTVLMVLSVFFTPLVIGSFMWASAQKIALWLNKDSSEIWLPEEKAIVSAGTFIVGIFWATRSLSAFFTLAVSGLRFSYPWLIMLLLPICLMLGSHRIAQFYSWLRVAGLSHNKSFRQPEADGTPDGAP